MNIAAYLIHDAVSGECEMACVVSSDSDLAEPIRMANEALSAGVTVFSPNVGHPSRRLADVATTSRRIADRTLRGCHFPDEVSDPSGAVVVKPAAW